MFFGGVHGCNHHRKKDLIFLLKLKNKIITLIKEKNSEEILNQEKSNKFNFTVTKATQFFFIFFFYYLIVCLKFRKDIIQLNI